MGQVTGILVIFTHLKVLKTGNFGAEWGRHGSPRAHTQSQRSHGLQEGFWIPPGPPGHHKMSKNDKKKVKNPKISKFSIFLYI